MRFETIGNQRHQQDVAAGPFGGFFANAPDEEVVGVERQMVAVVLDRPDRQDDNRFFLGHLAKFGPGVVLVEITFAHRWSVEQLSR